MVPVKLGINAMKITFTTLVVLCFLSATAAFGQATVGASALNSQPVVTEFASHPEHAAPHPMGQEQNLRERSGYVVAQGERPLWDVVQSSHRISLGEAARLLREQHANAKKAEIMWEN
jgi:hypothetical protein